MGATPHHTILIGDYCPFSKYNKTNETRMSVGGLYYEHSVNRKKPFGTIVLLHHDLKYIHTQTKWL